jgi:hypothetical protein
MKNIHGMIIVPFIIALYFIGCSPKSSDIIVLEVVPTNVNLAEYENFFTRNSGGWESGRKSTLEEREHFLDLQTENTHAHFPDAPSNSSEQKQKADRKSTRLNSSH